MIFKAACIQINSQDNLNHNIAKLSTLITHAHQQGAQFIALPENFALMPNSKTSLFNHAFPMDEHPALQHLQQLAQSLELWILAGSLQIALPGQEKIVNRSIVIDNQGTITGYYDKIHLYDAAIKNGETHRESEYFQPGHQAKTLSLPWGTLGLSICYDLRFPHLFRHLAKKGASFITVPSAFTYITGQAHWHSLLRARAIENTCFIIAPAQTGYHPRQRRTFGHSLIIDPWGRILAEANEEETLILASIDTALIHEVRMQLPSLEHDRLFD